VKISWPKSYRLIDKILATFAALVICAAWVAGFFIGFFAYFGG